MMDRKQKIVISTGVATTIAAGALAYFAWKKGRGVLERAKDWKKSKLQDMYYDSLTEKDVAWG